MIVLVGAGRWRGRVLRGRRGGCASLGLFGRLLWSLRVLRQSRVCFLWLRLWDWRQTARAAIGRGARLVEAGRFLHSDLG